MNEVDRHRRFLSRGECVPQFIPPPLRVLKDPEGTIDEGGILLVIPRACPFLWQAAWSTLPPPLPPPPSALQPSALQFSTESKRDDEKQSTHFLHTTLDHGHIQSHRHVLKTLGRATFSARIASYFQFLSVCPCPYVSSCLAVCWRSQALLERSHHPLP